MEIYHDWEPVYYVLCSFNKLKLNERDIILLSKIGFCPCCLKILFEKKISDKELEYINLKNWDEFLDEYPLRLNQCNCTKCKCGLNKILDIQYDLFDIEEKNPICYLSCSKCDKLDIPKFDRVKRVKTEETIDTKNKYQKIYSNIENINFNKKSCKNNLLIKSNEKNIIDLNNHLIYG